MISKTYLHFTLGLAALASICLAAPTSRADITFRVNVSTFQLIGNPAAPFYVDFQLNSGNTLNNNMVTISNFTFGGAGAPFGAPFIIGGAAGSLPLVVSIADSAAFNEFYQSFNAGGTLGFDVTISTNVDSGATPDVFTFGLLDNSQSNIPTTNFANALLLVNLDSSNPTIQTFRGTGAYDGVNVTVGRVPETGSTIVLLGIAGVGLIALHRKATHARAV